MDLRVLNPSFVSVGILDSVLSQIWTDRYYGFGDVEIYVKYSPAMLALLQEDYYLVTENSDRAMIIEDITIKTDPENGNKLLIKGRSLASLLDRRVILSQIIIDGSWQDAIQTILNQNVISSVYSERNFPNFIFSASTDTAITSLTLKRQYYYEGVYDAIRDLCEQAGIGFRVTLNSSNQMVFSMYAGKDRSYGQSTYPYVVFSPTFDNLIKSEFFHTKRFKKNYAVLRGDPASAPPAYPGYPLRGQAWTSDVGTGLTRREMFIDASDVSIYLDGTATKIADAAYLLQLTQRGLEVLAANPELTIFEGEVDLTRTFTYGVDFFLGDIVQMMDEYGHSSKVRIIEMTFSEDLSGSKTIPTLKTI